MRAGKARARGRGRGAGRVAGRGAGRGPGPACCHLAVADAASDGQRAPPRVGEMLNVKCYI